MDMNTHLIAYGLLAALAIAVLYAGITDLRHRKITNRLTGAIAIAAPLFWWASGLSIWPGVAIQIALAAGWFVFGALLFKIGQMGGGDVKLITAVALWLPPFALLDMLLLMSLLGGALTLLFLIERRWRRSEGPIEVPYGVAIALAGLLMVHEPLLNHFHR